jgi:tetratricopeptide (TPR) repeat protein
MGDKRAVDPPPYHRDYDLEIIKEIPLEGAAFALWRSLNKMLLWFRTPLVHRPKLHSASTMRQRPNCEFTREARKEVPELKEALDTFELFSRHPLAIRVASLAEACRQVALWSESQDYLATAVRFAEGAALVDHLAPHLANLAGRLTRNAAEFDRAELWFSRAVGLARSQREWIEYTRGHIGLGILWQTLGKDNQARACFATAASRAMRDGREWLAAEAQHDLMLMTTERGMFQDAEECARKALEWYPKYNDRFPFFVADLAFLCTSEQEHERAVALLGRFFRVVREPARQVLAMSVLARALGGLRNERFPRIRRQLLRRLEKFREYEAAARVNLAEGERAAGMWLDAEANARAAIMIARRTCDSAPERLGRRLLAQIAARELPPTRSPRSEDSALARLVSLAIARLDEWVPSQRGRRTRSSGGDNWAVA